MTGRSQERITHGANKSHSVRLITGLAENAVYSWQVSPAGGTSTELNALTDSSASIRWDGQPGTYLLTVSVIDGNGCVSEQVSKEVEIVASGELIFAATTPSTVVCSDLAGNVEGSSPPHSESLFQVVYAGEANLASATFTIENPDGQFVDSNGSIFTNQDNPEITVNNAEEDKTIDLAVADSWENSGNSNVEFIITVISALTTDNVEITAEPETDIVRSISVLPKPVIGF